MSVKFESRHSVHRQHARLVEMVLRDIRYCESAIRRHAQNACLRHPAIRDLKVPVGRGWIGIGAREEPLVPEEIAQPIGFVQARSRSGQT
jgi:hypothetical protein